jgi:hypothetical protein
MSHRADFPRDRLPRVCVASHARACLPKLGQARFFENASLAA